MATVQGNLTEVSITFSNGTTIAYAARCPDGSVLRVFLRNLVTELIKSVGAGKIFRFTDSTGTINFDRSNVESFTVTFS